MISIIIIAVLAWLASAAIRSKMYARHTHEIERIQEEQKRADRERREETARRLQIEHEVSRHAHELEKHEAWLRKHDEEIRKLHEKISTAEDQIEHFAQLAADLENDLDEFMNEIREIEEALSAKDTMNAIGSQKLKGYKNWHDASGVDLDAIKFMDASARKVGDQRTEKQKAADEAKMIKRRDSLKVKVRTLNNQIFSAEQKVKKAEFAKYEAECKLEEVS